MKVLVTGGCGYVGSVLVPKLLHAGHDVDIVDLMWFGNNFKFDRVLKNDGGCSELDILSMDFQKLEIHPDTDAVIHLAAVANDPTAMLNTELTWKTNAFGTMNLVENAMKAGVRRIIYASSGSVYGVSDEPQVTEQSPCVPVSAYNETKKVAERCLLSYADRMAVQIIRPATVCGYSPRMRLDVVVNMLTMQALTRGEITVLGGEQYRPNIHIEDMADLYLFMLEHPELTGIYNAGFENMTVMEIAQRIKKRVPCEIRVKPSNDPRSYRMNSDKLWKAGFRQKRSVQMAIADITQRYHAGELNDTDDCYNLRVMEKMSLGEPWAIDHLLRVS